jgi:hypothetical protein
VAAETETHRLQDRSPAVKYSMDGAAKVYRQNVRSHAPTPRISF